MRTFDPATAQPFEIYRMRDGRWFEFRYLGSAKYGFVFGVLVTQDYKARDGCLTPEEYEGAVYAEDIKCSK